MITRKEINQKPSYWHRYAHEYSPKCGWIDWTHAQPGRTDLESIWSQLPHSLKKGHKALAPNKVKVNGQAYYKVKFTIDQSILPSVVTGALRRPKNLTFLVRDVGSNELHYKRAALHMFMCGCMRSETYQYQIADFIHKSGFSMEDLVSNYLAFFMHVEAVSPEKVVQAAGGWQDCEVARKKSVQVFDAMARKKLSQPKCPFWFVACLFNHVCDLGISDKSSGWHALPDFFLPYEPLEIKLHEATALVLPGSAEEKLARDESPFGKRGAAEEQPTGLAMGQGRPPGVSGLT
ncbi:MAG TPA: hypothetical protein VM695_05505 [Phycisphaerae bacterium]|nr:hypothetical protein [Phycisphaerae bacterium]